MLSWVLLSKLSTTLPIWTRKSLISWMSPEPEEIRFLSGVGCCANCAIRFLMLVRCSKWCRTLIIAGFEQNSPASTCRSYQMLSKLADGEDLIWIRVIYG